MGNGGWISFGLTAKDPQRPLALWLPRLISGPKGKELISKRTKDSALFDNMVTWRRKLEDEYS